jgi:hypothetical protein
MTAQETKELSGKVWRYLRDNPSVRDKEDTPYCDDVSGMTNNEPLCFFFEWSCWLCPLGSCKYPDTLFGLWYHSTDDEQRRKYAGMIVDRIEAWDITEVDQ